MSSNWDHLEATFTSDEIKLIQHDCGRDLDSFTDADETVKLPESVYNRLPRVEVFEDDTFDDLPEPVAGSIGIITYDGVEYLVNTEGYEYARYVALVKVRKAKRPAKKAAHKHVTVVMTVTLTVEVPDGVSPNATLQSIVEGVQSTINDAIEDDAIFPMVNLAPVIESDVSLQTSAITNGR